MRYLLGFLVTVGLIVLIVVLLLSGGHSKSASSKAVRLTDYAYSSSATVSYVVDGPIQANQDHYTAKVSVSQNQVTAAMYQGYDQAPLRTYNYSNNSESFAVFMHALEHGGFTNGNNSNALQDERGYCPSGERMVYQLSDGTRSLLRFWHASCGQGTFKGSLGTMSYLFRQQIPNQDFQALTKDTNITF